MLWRPTRRSSPRACLDPSSMGNAAGKSGFFRILKRHVGLAAPRDHPGQRLSSQTSQQRNSTIAFLVDDERQFASRTRPGAELGLASVFDLRSSLQCTSPSGWTWRSDRPGSTRQARAGMSGPARTGSGTKGTREESYALPDLPEGTAANMAFEALANDSLHEGRTCSPVARRGGATRRSSSAAFRTSRLKIPRRLAEALNLKGSCGAPGHNSVEGLTTCFAPIRARCCLGSQAGSGRASEP